MNSHRFFKTRSRSFTTGGFVVHLKYSQNPDKFAEHIVAQLDLSHSLSTPEDDLEMCTVAV